MSHATHANAALTPKTRLKMARLIVDDEWPIAQVARQFMVSYRTAKKWAERYRDEGPDGMADRSSARHTQARKTPAPVVRKIVHVRLKQRLGPVEIADRLDMAPSTVHAVLVRCRLNRLSYLDRVTGNRSDATNTNAQVTCSIKTSRSSARSPMVVGGATSGSSRA
ncbi:helix-turn-helix domain-containing protein [Nocardioides lijunqiniae]|uniref:helix-turn-helix domain-containing protein n=1 Tax=Nocardioides lijunqiniae TaxID=2760832 RepID=UPI001878B92F